MVTFCIVFTLDGLKCSRFYCLDVSNDHLNIRHPMHRGEGGFNLNCPCGVLVTLWWCWCKSEVRSCTI